MDPTNYRCPFQEGLLLQQLSHKVFQSFLPSFSSLLFVRTLKQLPARLGALQPSLEAEMKRDRTFMH